METMSKILIGVVLIVIGIGNAKGNINSLHSYHRKRRSAVVSDKKGQTDIKREYRGTDKYDACIYFYRLKYVFLCPQPMGDGIHEKYARKE